MTLWIVMALLTVAALLPLLRPLTRRNPAEPPRAAYDLAVYKDQLAELDRDVARGVISPAEAAAARLEIQRRLLAAMPDGVEAEAVSTPAMPKTAIGLIVLVPLAVLGLYGALGQPNLPDAPLAGRTAELPLLADDGRLDLNKLRDALKQRLAATPDSLEGWLYLARTDGSLEDWVGARDAWRHARALGHDRPDILEGFGETLVGEAHGRITDEAQAVFRQLLAADAKSPAARYYLALAKAQHGDTAGAARDWRRLLADSPPESPWRGQVQQMIAQAGSAVPSPPADQQAAIMALPPEQRAQAIQGMVAGLAARLQAHPDDAEGWGRLARAYTVLGDKAKAADAAAHLAALNQAREAHP